MCVKFNDMLCMSLNYLLKYSNEFDKHNKLIFWKNLHSISHKFLKKQILFQDCFDHITFQAIGGLMFHTTPYILYYNQKPFSDSEHVDSC